MSCSTLRSRNPQDGNLHVQKTCFAPDKRTPKTPQNVCFSKEWSLKTITPKQVPSQPDTAMAAMRIRVPGVHKASCRSMKFSTPSASDPRKTAKRNPRGTRRGARYEPGLCLKMAVFVLGLPLKPTQKGFPPKKTTCP